VETRRFCTRRWLSAALLTTTFVVSGCSSTSGDSSSRIPSITDIVGKAKAATALPGSNPNPAPPAAPVEADTRPQGAPRAAGASSAATKAPAARDAAARKKRRAATPTLATTPLPPPAPAPAPVVRLVVPPVVTVSSAAPSPSRVDTPAVVKPPVPLRPPAEERLPIYSEADADVVPAKLLTPQKGGPSFRNITADVNRMEIVVSPQGRVEQVKLVTPPKRMTDMLMLSGAKTWRFSPALKNGQPVRYRTEFSWEMTP
jgi:hypothetical protein